MNLQIEKLRKVQITELIPQKEPFVMVDKLIDFSESKMVAALTVTSNNIFEKDQQFTEPGLIEHMAQTVALHTGSQFFLKNKPAPTGYIGSIKKCEIFELPKLNDEIITTASILHEIMGVTLVTVSVVLNGEEIANGEMKTVLAA